VLVTRTSAVANRRSYASSIAASAAVAGERAAVVSIPSVAKPAVKDGNISG
jgi:hypothetical protein